MKRVKWVPGAGPIPEDCAGASPYLELFVNNTVVANFTTPAAMGNESRHID
jgi:hypothetical protein